MNIFTDSDKIWRLIIGLAFASALNASYAQNWEAQVGTSLLPLGIPRLQRLANYQDIYGTSYYNPIVTLSYRRSIANNWFGEMQLSAAANRPQVSFREGFASLHPVFFDQERLLLKKFYYSTAQYQLFLKGGYSVAIDPGARHRLYFSAGVGGILLDGAGGPYLGVRPGESMDFETRMGSEAFGGTTTVPRLVSGAVQTEINYRFFTGKREIGVSFSYAQAMQTLLEGNIYHVEGLFDPDWPTFIDETQRTSPGRISGKWDMKYRGEQFTLKLTYGFNWGQGHAKVKRAERKARRQARKAERTETSSE